MASLNWHEPNLLEARKESPSVTRFKASIALIIALTMFVLVLVCFCVYAAKQHDEPPTPKTQNHRLELLEKATPSVLYLKWYQHDREIHPHWWHAEPADQDCVICLEVIKATDLIRALHCRHIYHKRCFDQWFVDSHEYCPLCHCSILSAESTV